MNDSERLSFAAECREKEGASSISAADGPVENEIQIKLGGTQFAWKPSIAVTSQRENGTPDGERARERWLRSVLGFG